MERENEGLYEMKMFDMFMPIGMYVDTYIYGRRGKLNYMVMTHPSLSPQPGIWGILLGLRVVRICGQSGKNMCQGGKPDTGKSQSSYIGMWLCQ